MSEQRDYRDTVFLPKTDFPMKAGLPQKEPGILARWEADRLYQQVRQSRAGRASNFPISWAKSRRASTAMRGSRTDSA